MKSAAFRCAALLITICSLAAPSLAVDVKDSDRVYTNFVREAATVGDRKFRLEVRGMTLDNEGGPELTLAGVPVETFERERNICTRGNKTPCVAPNDFKLDEVQGGVFDLLGSYGIGTSIEVGVDVPLYVQKSRFLEATDGTPNDPEVSQTINATDVGDVLFYGKYRHQLAENCAVAGGLELTVPTGEERDGFGTGDAGFNPFVSTRYQRGPFAVGGHLGYLLYAGSAANVVNWSVETILRGTALYSLRVELSGRYLEDYGQKEHDIVVLPGIDFYLTDYFGIRPTGLVGLRDESPDWGIGIGIVATL